MTRAPRTAWSRGVARRGINAHNGRYVTFTTSKVLLFLFEGSALPSPPKRLSRGDAKRSRLSAGRAGTEHLI
jgi:hypothetical protein